MESRQGPFEMAVLGDSVTWGSGLAEDDKFWKLVQGWIEQRLARPVHPQVVAHSLAVVAPDPAKDAAPRGARSASSTRPSPTRPSSTPG